jgi:hypothetical protein
MPPMTGGNNGALVDWNFGLRHRWPNYGRDLGRFQSIFFVAA